MPSLFTAQANLPVLVFLMHQLSQHFHNIFIAHRRFNKRDLPLGKIVDQSPVAHGRADHRSSQQPLLGSEIIRQNRQHMITIHQVTCLVHKDHTIRVTVKNNPKMGIIFLDQGVQIFGMTAHMLRTCLFIDVGAGG